MNPFDTAIDLDEISKRNGDSIVALIKMTFSNPADITPEIELVAQSFMKSVATGLGDTAKLVGEVKRLRGQRQKTRDIHAPANSSDPAAPGAVCTGCSIHGSRVAWPCPTWNATEDGR